MTKKEMFTVTGDYVPEYVPLNSNYTATTWTLYDDGTAIRSDEDRGICWKWDGERVCMRWEDPHIEITMYDRCDSYITEAYKRWLATLILEPLCTDLAT